MNVNEKEEIKREFQLERMILFSDAVFAIIITIMVLEMRVPEGIKHADGERLHEMIIELLRKFGGYILSFFIVGAFWIKHLKLFSYLKDYTQRLIILNLIFLFFISLFPFAVALLTETITPKNLGGLYIYFSVTVCALFSQTVLTGYIVKNAGDIALNPTSIESELQWKAQRLNYLTIPAMLVFMVIASIANLSVQVFNYGFIAWALIMVFIRKKLYPDTTHANNGPLIARLFKRKIQ
ncbi:TMEM175 family protein [Mucilaginibacter sp. HD30]